MKKKLEEKYLIKFIYLIKFYIVHFTRHEEKSQQNKQSIYYDCTNIK